MNNRIEIKISFAVIISFFLHAIFVVAVIMPEMKSLYQIPQEESSRYGKRRRQIIVNINEDHKKVIDKRTMISDRDSSARGYITADKGDSWLLKSFDFQRRSGAVGKGKGKGKAVKVKGEKILLADESEVVAILHKKAEDGSSGAGGSFIREMIPQRININRKNSLYYTKDGMFSFNTINSLHPEVLQYLKRMVKKIANNWSYPILSKSYWRGYGGGVNYSGIIPAQDVKILFGLNKKGDVLFVRLIDSYHNEPLDSSCVDAVRLSRNFGPLPSVIKKEKVYVPFIFIWR